MKIKKVIKEHDHEKDLRDVNSEISRLQADLDLLRKKRKVINSFIIIHRARLLNNETS